MRLIRLVATLFAAALVAAPALAVPEIAVGAKVPAGFIAIDSNGKPRTLSSIMGKKGTVLVFFRSARWCPFCQAQLKEMRSLQAPLAQRGYALAAISYDAPDALAKFAGTQGIGYTLLSDQKSAMIDAFGLRDPSYAAGSFAAGVPRASTLIVSPKGVVRWKTVATDYKIRPQNTVIIHAVDALPPR